MIKTLIAIIRVVDIILFILFIVVFFLPVWLNLLCLYCKVKRKFGKLIFGKDKLSE